MAATACPVDSDLINPDMIPGDDMDPAAIAGSATGFSAAGTAVTEKGAAVVTEWAALSGVYVAPEATDLLDVMNPVSVDSAALGQTFTAVSKIVADFADDVAPLKTRLAAIREEARAFVADVSGGVTVYAGDSDYPSWLWSLVSPGVEGMLPMVITWREHKPSVEANKELLRRVNAEVAALNTASADCVNAINALRDDTRVAPVVPHTAAEMNADGVVLPWGAATDGDRSGLESFGDGAWDAAVGMWQGAAALVGFNAVTGEGDGELAGQAWFGVGMLVGGIASYAQYGVTPPAGQGTDLAARVQADFYEKSTAQVDAAVLALVASDKWAENPAEAAGATLVNVGSLFLGGGAGAGVKAASIGGRAATIVGHVADFAVPAGSWGVRGATAGLLHAGHGLSVVTDAARLSLVSGVNASRGALAQALHTLADSIPTVRIQPGYSAVTPDGAGFGAVPRLAVGEPGSGGGVLHSVAGRVDVGRAPDTIQIDAPARPVVVDSELGPDTIQFEPPARPAGVEPVSGPAQWQPEVQHPTITHRTIVAGSDVPGVRTPFTERTGLSPNTAYDVEGRGTFYTDDLGRVVVVETDYGPRAALNPDLQKPLANATYIVGGEHVFRTDDLARVSSVDVAHLGLGDAPRSRHVQSTVGSIGGIGFDGGHLVGNATAGGAERINLVAMLREVNRGSGPSYFNLENRWRSILAGDPPPNIAVSIRPLYPEGSPVPSEIRVSYQVDGGEVYRARFANRS